MARAVTMGAGLLRIATKGGTFRRGGFRFAPDPVILTGAEVTPQQFVDLASEPRLLTELEVGGVFTVVTAEMIADVREMIERTGAGTERLDETAFVDRSTIGRFSTDVLAAARRGNVDFEADARRQALAASSAMIPGKGAGADHPAATFETPIQADVDPNPPLPAGGGASDAAVPARTAADGETLITTGLALDAADLNVAAADGAAPGGFVPPVQPTDPAPTVEPPVATDPVAHPAVDPIVAPTTNPASIVDPPVATDPVTPPAAPQRRHRKGDGK